MYSLGIAYLLWFLGGFGFLGWHRFYLRKFGTGLLYLFTGGLMGIGAIYDLFTLPSQVREANIREHYYRALYASASPNMGNTWKRPLRDVTEKPVGGNRDSLEKTILKLAKKNMGVITPAEVALDADVSLDKAKALLEKLVDKGFAELRVSKSGNLVYVFNDFYTPDASVPLENF